MKVIIFKSGEAISLMSVAQGLDIFEVGIRFVPDGVPFWIVDRGIFDFGIPQEKWDIDFESLGDPSGIGCHIIEIN
ncbi:hypothetical protein ABK735_21475 [Enterobacter kobei]|uniref:hypothetical protein n=1 Tax=Enterobacter kobei TaxID=208224 RepID=UPI001F156BCE|nr:hypothetical protein [Enterobacter kobei]HBM0952478.1 hypothetical protein [Enterobacter kobei]HBM0982172.1 hypothetical protein [Enterobacter kobei]HCR0432224.1 hypothetical protein [Enterobacter kobei]